MKKILLSVFVASLILVLVFALAGCEHEHEWGEWKTTKEPTCTEKGVQERVCKCGEKETKDVEALGHTEVVDAAVAPSCTETGLTEGKHCSVCNKMLVAQETVEALGHNYLVVSLENDGVAGSSITYNCQNCDSSYDQIIEEISVSVKLDGMSSATINGYGSYTKYYVAAANGGYGDYHYKYEVFSDSNSTVPMSHLTKGFSGDSEYAISYRGYMDAISGYVLQVTVIDEAGNQAVCRYTI